jgi:hypothetical protein
MLKMSTIEAPKGDGEAATERLAAIYDTVWVICLELQALEQRAGLDRPLVQPATVHQLDASNLAA